MRRGRSGEVWGTYGQVMRCKCIHAASYNQPYVFPHSCEGAERRKTRRAVATDASAVRASASAREATHGRAERNNCGTSTLRASTTLTRIPGVRRSVTSPRGTGRLTRRGKRTCSPSTNLTRAPAGRHPVTSPRGTGCLPANCFGTLLGGKTVNLGNPETHEDPGFTGFLVRSDRLFLMI